MCRKVLSILFVFLSACTAAPEPAGYVGADLAINARFLDIPAGNVSGALVFVDTVNYCGESVADGEDHPRYFRVSQGYGPIPLLSDDARVLLAPRDSPSPIQDLCPNGGGPFLSTLRLFTLWSLLGVEPPNDDGSNVFPGYWAPVGLELVYAPQATTFSPFGPAGQSVAFPQGYSWLRRTCGASPGQIQMEARPIEETAEFRPFDSHPPTDDPTQSYSPQEVEQSELSLVEGCGAALPAEDLGTCILFGRAQSLVWSADSASIDYLASADPQDPTQSAGLGSVRLADSVVSELAVVPFGQRLQIDSTGQLYVVGQVGGAYSMLRVVLGTSPAASLVVVPLQVNASGGGEPTIPVLSPDGRWFAYTAQDGLHVWDIQSSSDQTVGAVDFLGWSPDSKLTYWPWANPQTLNVVSPAALGEPMIFDIPANGSPSVVWNTNGPLLAQPPLAWSIESDDTSGCSFCFGLSLQDPSTGAQRQVLDASAGKIDIVSTPPVLGFMLVWARTCLGLYNTVCSYSLLRVDLTDGTARTVAIAGHEYPVAVSPDNQRIAIASPTGIYVKSLVQ